MIVTRLIAKSGIYCIFGDLERALSFLKLGEFVKLNETDSCHLDCGGMMFIHSPTRHFDVGPFKFSIQVDKASGVERLLEKTKEFGPYSVFRNYPGFLVVPTEIIPSLKEVVREISMSDDALHAHLDREIAIAGCKQVIRSDVFKEFPDA